MANQLQDFFDLLKEGNYSVNYYLPQDAAEKYKEDTLKEIQYRMRMGLMNNMGIMRQLPSSHTISNIWDPLVRGDVEGLTVPLDQPIPEEAEYSSKRQYLTNKELAELGPTMQLAPKILKNFSPTFKHEAFHAIGQANPEIYENYWGDWKRSTSSSFLSNGEWASSLYRKARAAKEQDIPSAMYQFHWKNNGPTQGLEELAAYIYEGGMKKPSWMSDRDYNILGNYIRTRMNMWEDIK